MHASVAAGRRTAGVTSPRLAGYAAALWSLGYALLALTWALGTGYPFGPVADPEAGLSLLGGVPQEVGAPVIACLSLAGAAVGTAMLRGLDGRVVRPGLIAFGAAASVVLAVLIPDYRVLVIVAYAPIVLLGAPFGWPPGVNIANEVTWSLVNQLLVLVGGLAWGGATVGYLRRTTDACEACGRRDTGQNWTSPEAARWWGRWAVAVAVGIPLLYAATRWAWALGVPLGISEAFLREGQASGAWVAGAMLATVAAIGAGLTVGLAKRWGEVFPARLPVVGGRRVPPALAIIPASFIAIAVTAAGLMFVRLVAFGGLPFTAEEWGAVGPELLWPVWGVALGLATVAYHLRRRGRCEVCKRE